MQHLLQKSPKYGIPQCREICYFLADIEEVYSVSVSQMIVEL